MSLSGPVPRSHSPEVRVRSSRFIGRRPWGGAGRGAGRPARSPRGRWRRGSRIGGGAGRGRTATGRPPGALPTCRVAPCDRREQGEQAPGEDLVVGRAAEPAPGPELHEADAAVGAGQLGQLADELADVGHDQALDDLRRARAWAATRAGPGPALRAQGTQRWSSRRRPSTVSVRWTAASSWHRWQVMGQATRDGTSRSASQLVFDRLDLVPDPGGHLVVLGGDGPLQLVAELDQLGLAAGSRGARRGNLPVCRVSSWMFSSSGISSSRKTS